MIRGAWLALAVLFWPALALAQGTVQQSGPVGAQHLAMYIGNGRAVDAGGPPGHAQPPANQANPGTLPTGLGVVNNNSGFAVFSGYSGNPYSEFLWGLDYLGTGDGLIKLDRVGGGGPLKLWCEINGVRFECFSGSGGSVAITGEHGIYTSPDPITGIGSVGCNILSASVLGCAKVDGTTITANADGVITGVAVAITGEHGIYTSPDPITGIGSVGCNILSASVLGCAKVDGTTITANADGVITAVGGGSGGVPLTLDSYTTGGVYTWAKQPGVSVVCVVVYAGGGGGGGGAGSDGGIGRGGGSAGGGGARIEGCVQASALNATEEVTVGSGGAGGTGAVTANGSAGSSGSSSSFKSTPLIATYEAFQGGGGAGGQDPAVAISGGGGGGIGSPGTAGGTRASTGGLPTSAAGTNGISGGGAGTAIDGAGGLSENGGSGGGGSLASASGLPGGTSIRGGRGGGGGGGINPVFGIFQPGSRGGGTGYVINNNDGGTAGSVNGAAGGAGTSGTLYTGGLGGGGGAGSATGTAGAGGDGGACGGGGGGGGGGLTGGGNGGAGAAGCVFVYQW